MKPDNNTAKFAKIISCLAFLLVLSSSTTYAQIYNNGYSERMTLREQGGTTLSLKLLGTTISNSGATSYFTSGYGASGCVSFKMGKVVSFFLEATICRVKYVDDYVTQIISEGMKPTILISIGTKIYPSRDNFTGYAKIGLGLMSRRAAKNNGVSISIPPVLDLGIGYEIKLSQKINLFPEGDINFIGQSTDFLFGIGAMYVL